MDRRKFIKSSIIAATTAAISPIQAHANTNPAITIFDKILQSFPEISDETKGFLTVSKINNPEAQHTLNLTSIQENDRIENESFEKFIKKRFMTISYINTSKNNKHIETILNMNHASNNIAASSLLGRGRKYAVLDNNAVLIWYKGIREYDTPIYRNKNSFYFNPNYLHYFRKINGISFHESDHEILKTIGFQRIS